MPLWAFSRFTICSTTLVALNLHTSRGQTHPVLSTIGGYEGSSVIVRRFIGRAVTGGAWRVSQSMSSGDSSRRALMVSVVDVVREECEPIRVLANAAGNLERLDPAR